MRKFLFAAALALMSAWAQAWPTVTMSFAQATGTAGPSDSIDVWVTLAVDPNGPALHFDPNGGSPFGLDPADLPTQGYSSSLNQNFDFTSYSGAYLSFWYGCSGTFTDSCSPGAYTFNFAPTDGLATLADANGVINLAPGSSYTVLAGSFVPTSGTVAPGTYTFYRSTIGLSVFGSGVDADGNPVTDLSSYTFPYQTCNDNDDSCAFTRVVAVPEPQIWLLMGCGIAVLAWRRRQAR